MIRGRGWLAVLALGACAADAGPRLTSVTPASAPVSSVVTIAGEGLCGPTGNCDNAGGQIMIGLDPPSVEAMIVSYAATSAQILVPPVTPVGKTSLVLTVQGRSSNALDFEVVP